MTLVVVHSTYLSLNLGDGVFDVLSTAGDNKLGGDDFDQKIIDHLVAEFKKENGIDLSTDKMAMQTFEKMQLKKRRKTFLV